MRSIFLCYVIPLMDKNFVCWQHEEHKFAKIIFSLNDLDQLSARQNT